MYESRKVYCTSFLAPNVQVPERSFKGKVELQLKVV